MCRALRASIRDALSSAQQFGVKLRQFFQLQFKFGICLDASLGLFSLSSGLQEKLVNPADGKALDEVLKRAMF